MEWNGMYKLKPYIWNQNLIGLIQYNNHQLEVTECHNVLGTISKKKKAKQNLPREIIIRKILKIFCCCC